MPALRAALVGSLLLVCSRAGATYSLVVADKGTRQLGSVGTSCTGSSAVSRISGIAPGFGVIHAQAASNADGRDRGLMMLKQGATPDAIISAITAPTFDLFAASRQYGVVTLAGMSAGYTGSSNGAYADDRQQVFGDYVTSYQGNILTSGKVLDQLAASLQRAEGCDLADTLMLALEAGAENGEGDSRCTGDGIPADAGFLKVVAEDGRELISIEVTSQSQQGAVAALRVRFDDWRASHACEVAGAPALDAGGMPADAQVSDARAADAGVPDAQLPSGGPADAAVAARLDASVIADAAVRDASVQARDAGVQVRDAGIEQDVPANSGCALGKRAPDFGFSLLALLGLAWRRRRSR